MPGAVLRNWLEGRFELASCEQQIEELRRVTRYPKIRSLVPAPVAGHVVKDLRESAIWIEKLPTVDICQDPMDNYLLALSQAGDADCLVTGDKADLLSLRQYGRTRVVTVRRFAELIRAR